MRIRLSLGAVVSAAWLTFIPIDVSTRHAQPPGDVAIIGAAIIDATGSAPRVRSVFIRDGRIEAIRATTGDTPVRRGTTVIDGHGRFLIPGLWDMHVHLAVRPEPELAERIMLPMFLAHGVVGVRDMGGPLDRVVALRDRVKAGELVGPRILTPGPFLDGPGTEDAAFRHVTSAADVKGAIDALVSTRVDFLKVQANLGDEAYSAIVREARARHLSVVGHIPVALSAERVIEAGQRSVEHISPALVGDAGLLFACSNRADELRAELRAIERDRHGSKPADIAAREAVLRRRLVETYDEARAQAIGRLLHRHGTWIVPTLIWSNSFRPLRADDTGAGVPLEHVPAATRTRWQQRRAALLKAGNPSDFQAASDVARVAQKAVGALHRAGAAVLAGTDTFDAFVLPGVSLHQELGLLVGAGLTQLEAIQAATRNAAAYRGSAAREGTIERGKRADLVLLDADPLADISNVARVHAVVADGRVFRREDLDRLLDGARTSAR